jgi:hypothetical protein
MAREYKKHQLHDHEDACVFCDATVHQIDNGAQCEPGKIPKVIEGKIPGERGPPRADRKPRK